MRLGSLFALLTLSVFSGVKGNEEVSICDRSWGPIYRRIDHTMTYLKSTFNSSFEFVLDELDELIDESKTSLQVKLQDNVVALAEDQRRIARMHRQLVAAIDNGAVPSDSFLQKSGLRSTTVDLSVKTTINEIVHGESWFILAGQVVLAVALGSGYERYRSGKKVIPGLKSN